MFVTQITGAVSQLLPNDQSLFQCVIDLTVPLEFLAAIQSGTLVAVENVYSAPKKQRYAILQMIDAFPVEEAKKPKSGLTLRCTAMPLGLELLDQGAKKPPLIEAADTFPTVGANAVVLDDQTTMSVIHQIAPESRSEENGSRIDIGTYATNPTVNVGLDMSTLVRGNIAVISARPRARTTITTSLLNALLSKGTTPIHVVYCDVNNQGTMSLLPLLNSMDQSSILCLNDKFVPQSVYLSMKNPSDRSAYKRATLDYLDMMVLPSMVESRRQDLSFAVSTLFRANKIAIYRPNEQTIGQFLNDIRIDILDGVESDVESFISGVINGIVDSYGNERFGEKNMRDILEMIDEFSADTKSHGIRRTLYDLRAEIQAANETYSKDVPSNARKSIQDVVSELNDDTRSSLLVVQGQKTTDILRFIGTLVQTLVDERLKRLKIRVPVLFIFNNVDEYVPRNGGSYRESGADRFVDLMQTLLANGRRHGLGFCLSLESAGSIDRTLARKIHSYFIGPITFTDEPPLVAQLLNMSTELIRPAVAYEDGHFLYASSDSPYHRRVPLPVTTVKNTVTLHTYLDSVHDEAERRKQEYYAQEEERQRRQAQEREERRKRQEEEAARKAEAAAAQALLGETEPPAAEGAEAQPRKDRDDDRRGDKRNRDKGGKDGGRGRGPKAPEPAADMAAEAAQPAEAEAKTDRDRGGDRNRGKGGKDNRRKDDRREKDDRRPKDDRREKSPAEAAPVKDTEPAALKDQTPADDRMGELTIQSTRYGGYDVEPSDDRDRGFSEADGGAQVETAPSDTMAGQDAPASEAAQKEHGSGKKRGSRGSRGGRRRSGGKKPQQ